MMMMIGRMETLALARLTMPMPRLALRSALCWWLCLCLLGSGC